MLSFFNKREKKSSLEHKIQAVEDKLETQEKQREEQRSLLLEEMQRLLSRQRKSETMLEDISAVLEECREEYRTELKSRSLGKSSERALVDCILSYEEGLYHMEQMLRSSGGEAAEWAAQLQILGRHRQEVLAEAGISVIKESGGAVDFTRHEVAGTQSTGLAGEGGLVCEVVMPGISYRGEVLTRAKVIAYKYQEETDK